MSDSTYIYFARESRTGLVKIGRSIEPYRRIEQLRIDEECEIVLLAEVVCTQHPAWCERAAQLMFADKHVRGEWFRLSPDDITAAVAVLQAIRKEDIPQSYWRWPRIPWRARKKKFVAESV